jgi:1-deoxy-D-xylulose-5-phosphate reductoisomerase
MRRISVFGATGSIGQNTLDLIARAPGDYDVVALTAAATSRNWPRTRAPGADVAVTAYEDRLDDLRDALAGSGWRPRRGRPR